MFVELEAGSQLTIPEDIAHSLKLKEGDQFEISLDGGKIVLIPVVSYPEPLISHLKDQVHEMREAIKKGEQPVFIPLLLY